jgi:hypothetical protein
VDDFNLKEISLNQICKYSEEFPAIHFLDTVRVPGQSLLALPSATMESNPISCMIPYGQQNQLLFMWMILISWQSATCSDLLQVIYLWMHFL